MITPAQFAVFVTTVNTMWGTVYESMGVEEYHQKIATTIPLDGAEQWEIGWTGMMPKARVWSGPRHVYEAAPQTYIAVPRPYELTYAIDRFLLDDDKFGVYYRILPDLARQVKRWPDLELRDLLEGAGAYTSTTVQQGLDGLANWSTAHPINLYNAAMGTYINDFTGGGQNVNYPKPGGGNVTTLVGGALTPVAFSTLWEYMSTIKGEDNEALGVTPTDIMVAPQLKAEAEIILKSMFFAPPQWGVYVTGQVGAADNPLKRFGVNYIENKFLKNAYTWYLMDLGQAIKPFTWVLRESPVIVPRLNENDPVVYDTHMYQWGAWMRGCPAWSFAFLCARSGP